MNTLIIIAINLREKETIDISTQKAELEGLCVTGGFKPCAFKKIILKEVTPSYYIGIGKVKELAAEIANNNIKAVVFMNNLTSLQQKNLCELLNAQVMDKTCLILKIFEQRARSPEGKLQVKLAKASYEMTRLYGRGNFMDQQEGMIGARGAGEKIAEYKKRQLKEKFLALRKELERVKKERLVQRNKRRSVPLPQISIVGYTNCGKSTLLSTLTMDRHNIYTDDRLFATLDTVTKRVRMPAGYNMLFSDTVGFISGLPTFLVEAFKSTVEEIKYSDLIIHLKDLSNPNWQQQSDCVKKLLYEMKVADMPIIEVFNKTDKLPYSVIESMKENPLYKSHIFICAKERSSLNPLLKAVENYFSQAWERQELFISHQNAASILGKIEKISLIEKRLWLKNKLYLSVIASKGNMERIKKLIGIYK